MPADREGERVGHINFLRFYRSNFMDWVVGGGRDAGGSYSRRRCFWYACQRVGKQARRIFLLCFPRSSFTDWVLGEKKRVSASLYSMWQGFSMHVKGSEARARGVSLIWAVDILWTRGSSGVFGGALLSMVARLAGREDENEGHAFLLLFHCFF